MVPLSLSAITQGDVSTPVYAQLRLFAVRWVELTAPAMDVPGRTKIFSYLNGYENKIPD